MGNARVPCGRQQIGVSRNERKLKQKWTRCSGMGGNLGEELDADVDAGRPHALLRPAHALLHLRLSPKRIRVLRCNFRMV